METQAQMDVAHRELHEERAKEVVEEITETEKEFLNDLYSFMKKRDTPIERIPNLGFKQIDLFVMFKTVRDFGGYHQVTAQQLWKQVYNTLGGNPRSTSAATCTRRHYEKLLLPYECHVKGISMNILTNHQSKHFHYANHCKDDDDGQRPAKRKLLSMPLHQNPHTSQSDQHGSAFLLPLHYPRYHHTNHTVLPPHIPISSSVLTPHTPPAPQRQFSFDPYHLRQTERVNEPLEHLRYLAERYKTSSGLAEPLNLSVKASRQEPSSNPASSFAPPSASKTPRFLNKPSPLYTAHSSQAMRTDETEDGEKGLGDTPYSHPAKAGERYVIDVKTTASRSPTYDSAPIPRTDEDALVQNPSSPKSDFTMRPKGEREGSPGLRGVNRSNEKGAMEIEIPLSVFHNWLRLCRSSTMMHGDKQPTAPPTPEQHPGPRNYSNRDILPTNLTFHMSPQQWSSATEDLRLRQRNAPSPTPNTQTTGNHHNTSQHPFTSYKPLYSGGILKNAAARDVSLFDQSYSCKPPNRWDSYEQETPIPMKADSNVLKVQKNFAASKPYNEETAPGVKEKSEVASSAVLLMNSSSTPVLHLTSEEVMKLKKIISSSS